MVGQPQAGGARRQGTARQGARRAGAGFTLIELLVVLAIIAALVTLALPRYFHSVERSKETVLRHDLVVMREAIDKFMADKGHYPETLDDLVEFHYLRQIPPDPITESTSSWIADPNPDAATSGVFDVHSGAEGATLDGVAFREL